MGIQYQNLDAKTREFMLKEIELDCASRKLYISPRLNSSGRNTWEALLKEAALHYNDDWLADALRSNSCLSSHELRTSKGGKTTSCQVPITAPDTLSEGEFNRFYCRGLCSRAISEGTKEVEIYRGKQVMNSRWESEQKIGNKLDPSALLADLRVSQGLEPALGIPPGPNSGLTIKLV
jgi:hypothetical protein